MMRLRKVSGVVAAASLLLVTAGSEVLAGDKPTFLVGKGPAKGSGQITLYVRYKQGNTSGLIQSMIQVDDNDTRDAIATKIKNTLTTGGASVFTVADYSKEGGAYKGAICTLKPGVRLQSLPALGNLPAVPAVEVSIPPGLKGISVDASADPPPSAFGYLHLTGSTGQSNDILEVELSTQPDPSSPLDVDTFSLSSYAGLSPADVEDQLASLIDASPSYAATVLDDNQGNRFVAISGHDPSFGVHLFLSTADSIDDGPSFGGNVGIVVVQAVPALSIRALLGLLLALMVVGGAGMMRRRAVQHV